LSSDVRFVAKRELLATPLIGTILRRGGHLAVERAELERSVADAEHASAVLHGGASIVFFAEGTFVRAPGLLPFKLGAFKAAVENGRPVVPVTINGTREVWPDGRRIPSPGRIDVVIGRPLRPERTGWVEMVRLRDAVRAEIESRLREIRSDDGM
jgi:1-acyl-sn-glycerol-3-phosphate acyltransferase